MYQALANHQKTEKTWELQELIGELLLWASRFNFEFQLEIQEISLSVDWLKRTRFGHFHTGHNGFGLKGEIAINRRYLDRPFWQILGTLLHELLHAFQQAYGKPGKRNYHNKEFCEKALSLGLIVDQHGFTLYEKDEEKSPFLQILKKYGVQVSKMPEVMDHRKHGSSKLKKWSCGCTNVRVAVDRFAARCLLCGNIFQKLE